VPIETDHRIETTTPDAAGVYRRERLAHWEAFARQMDRFRGWGGTYQRRLAEIYSFLIPPGQRVLELGCADGRLLAAVRPKVGVGVDFAPEMIRRASAAHPELRFIEADVHDLMLDETFDAIICSDLVNDLWDVQAVFERIARLTTPRTRVILNFYSRLWEPPLRLAERIGAARPNLQQSWFTVHDVQNLLALAGFETIRHSAEVLCPLGIPLLGPLCNRWLVKLWPFRFLALTNVLIARPEPSMHPRPQRPRVSVVVPARNEAGNVPAIFERVPEMGGGTEIIFVEGHSRDDTYAAAEHEIARRPDRPAKLLRQTGRGKGDAVRLGFAQASGDVLMILDADLTVPPEDLPRFYEALVSGHGEFVNGVRLVYPMESQAMRFFNLVGNKFFGWAFSWLLGQPIKDTLCGTKVLWRSEYEVIAANRAYFGDFDPFGDFDLIFGAARLNLKIVDLPVRYRERTYGETNIQRWSHGWLLLRMVAFAATRIKFV
jgi:SAM-dependent methyltransferase